MNLVIEKGLIGRGGRTWLNGMGMWWCGCLIAGLAGGGLGSVRAATLEVGAGKRFQRIEDANAVVRDGDVVMVYPLPDHQPYEKTAVFVERKNVTFRAAAGAGEPRVRISGTGYDYSGAGHVPRAIFQFNRGADGCVLEGFELTEAHNGSHNGAGVRINQANDITVRTCEIQHNDMGIMSNGDGSEEIGANQRIERCVIHHNGNRDEPGQNHNLYLGGASVTLFACEVYGSLTGHNVKSRAHLTTVACCYIHDSNNREFDLVDAKETELPGSDALLFGNIIVKDPACQGNRSVIHFGQDGGKHHDGTITLLNNTIVTPFVSPVVDLSAAQARARLVNNIICDGGSGQKNMTLIEARRGGADAKNAAGTHNLLAAGLVMPAAGFPADSNGRLAAMPPFANPKHGDYHLTAATPQLAGTGLAWEKAGISPSLLAGLAAIKLGGSPLAWQYRQPADVEARTDHGTTLGAYGTPQQSR